MQRIYNVLYRCKVRSPRNIARPKSATSRAKGVKFQKSQQSHYSIFLMFCIGVVVTYLIQKVTFIVTSKMGKDLTSP